MKRYHREQRFSLKVMTTDFDENQYMISVMYHWFVKRFGLKTAIGMWIGSRRESKKNLSRKYIFIHLKRTENATIS